MLHLLAFVPFNSADRHLIEAENVNHVGIYLKMVVIFAKFKPSDVFYAQFQFLRVFSWVQCGGTNNSSLCFSSWNFGQGLWLKTPEGQICQRTCWNWIQYFSVIPGSSSWTCKICAISRFWVLAVVRNLCISGEVASTWFGTVQVQIHDKIRKMWTILFYF